jgi:hypothetical protein
MERRSRAGQVAFVIVLTTRRHEVQATSPVRFDTRQRRGLSDLRVQNPEKKRLGCASPMRAAPKQNCLDLRTPNGHAAPSI